MSSENSHLKTSDLLKRLDRFLDLTETLYSSQMVKTVPLVDLIDKVIAFRWQKNGQSGYFHPVEHPDVVDHRDLIGIDRNLGLLNRNTLQFVKGFSANNVLLWGERGSGKSSAIKGLLRDLPGQGLRIIEVRKEDLWQLHEITRHLRGLPYRFVLFCDDLSFDEVEVSYRELKAVLEGGIEARPENVLIYATSNRRHLMPESLDDNISGNEIHPHEAVSEKLSLSDRFGMRLGFYPMDRKTYLAIVYRMAEKARLLITPQKLQMEAEQWSLRQGGRSGRAARQFIDDLSGRLGLAGSSGAAENLDFGKSR
ncbi:MAG: ATP-binding protein [Deltaproteobacteria bacterium]|nr:ATP-binding protein [Deltaproteobacteria bacterium]